jgi:hypothetical protein
VGESHNIGDESVKLTAEKLNSIWEALESADPSKCLLKGHEGCNVECESTIIHFETLTPVKVSGIIPPRVDSKVLVKTSEKSEMRLVNPDSII